MKALAGKEMLRVLTGIPDPGHNSTIPVYPSSLSEKDLEDAIVFERLHLYNSSKPCGAAALQKHLLHLGMKQVPSKSKISRILSKNCLTFNRTGFYPEDYS